jgi:actin-like ATPase involved in cell morphogenesis
MGYRLGVDLGTTFTSAAVDDGSGPRMVGLGRRTYHVPSVLFLQHDGAFLCGEAAEGRGMDDPDRLVRPFKRRIGDPVPVLVAGQPHSAHALTAKLLRWVLTSTTALEGGPPEHVVLTYPANWGAYKRELFSQAIALADAPDSFTSTEPEAAATHYAAHTRLLPGNKIAVYDLGGGTFDVCVLEKQAQGFRIVGTPDGIEQLGGIDFDETVTHYVLSRADPAFNFIDEAAPRVTDELTRLRRDCREAKEALSTDVEAVVPVSLPGLTTTVTLTRNELEGLIGALLEDTVLAMRRALASANTTPEQLEAIVLVGGSSRIPLVSELLQEQFNAPIALHAHPEYAVALGASRLLLVGTQTIHQPAAPSIPTASAEPPPPMASAPHPPESAGRLPRIRVPRSQGGPSRRSHQAKSQSPLMAEVESVVSRTVQPGRLMFNPPAEMRQGQVERLEVGVSGSRELDDQLRSDLRGRGIVQYEDVSTSPFMTVLLRGDGFAVTTLSPSEQLVAPLARWEFDVTPNRAGDRELQLCVSMRIAMPGMPLEQIAIPVFERRIHVRVDPVYAARYFTTQHWQWLVGTLVGLAGGITAWYQLFRPS